LAKELAETELVATISYEYETVRHTVGTLPAHALHIAGMKARQHCSPRGALRCFTAFSMTGEGVLPLHPALSPPKVILTPQAEGSQRQPRTPGTLPADVRPSLDAGAVASLSERGGLRCFTAFSMTGGGSCAGGGACLRAMIQDPMAYL